MNYDEILTTIDEIEIRVAYQQHTFDDGNKVTGLAEEVQCRIFDRIHAGRKPEVETMDLAVLIALHRLAERLEAAGGDHTCPCRNTKRILDATAHRVIY